MDNEEGMNDVCVTEIVIIMNNLEGRHPACHVMIE